MSNDYLLEWVCDEIKSTQKRLYEVDDLQSMAWSEKNDKRAAYLSNKKSALYERMGVLEHIYFAIHLNTQEENHEQFS